MKIAMTLIMLFLLVSAAPPVLAGSYDDYQRFRKGTYDFQLETRYFKSDANYDSSGNSYTSLNYGRYYQVINSSLSARYDLSRRSSFYGDLGMANATSQGLDAQRNNSGLTDTKLGYAYRAYSEGFDLIGDFNVVVPFNKISDNTDSVIIGEGVIQATALLRAQKEINEIVGFGYIGGTLRQNRSSLLPWGVGGEYNNLSWGLGGKIFGYQSITNDPNTGNRTQRTIVWDRVDGGSMAYYALNPSVIDSEIYARVKFAQTWTLTGGGGLTLMGANSASGYHVELNIGYAWESAPSYYMNPSAPVNTVPVAPIPAAPPGSLGEGPISSEKKVPKFKEETNDGVDQTLFQKNPPPPPPPRKSNRPPIGSMSPALDGLRMRRVRPETPPGKTKIETIRPSDSGGGNLEVVLKKTKKKKKKSNP